MRDLEENVRNAILMMTLAFVWAGTVAGAAVTGADVDEKAVKETLEVGADASYKTISAAIDKAKGNLKDGVPTRVSIRPGTYREGEFTIDANQIGGKAAETLLIIEAKKPGSVIISGADAYPLASWKPVKNAAGKIVCYEHEWTYDFGFNPGGWAQFNPKLPYEHRREMMFVDGQPLRQVMLERYKYIPVKADPKEYTKSLPFGPDEKTDPFKGVPQDHNFHGRYEYLGFSDPAETLKPGQFGIAERDENGNKIFFTPPEGVNLSKALIEVSTRQYHLWAFYKSNLVLRGLTFEKACTRIEAHAAVRSGHWYNNKELTNNNVLIEDCHFLWNNGRQLSLDWGRDVTLRRNKINYGGYGGIGQGMHDNLLMEENETNFNGWRVAGGWASGPVKLHNLHNAAVLKHTSIGNNGTGLWWDISCANIVVEGALLVGNTTGFDFEISKGMTLRNSLIALNRGSQFWIPTAMDMTVENCIVYGTKGKGVLNFEAGLRDSDEKLAKLLDRPVIDKYQLGPVTLRNNAIVSGDADVPVFFQEHGNPDLFEQFIKTRLTNEHNLWFAPGVKPFGTRRDYSGNWQKLPVKNVMVDHTQFFTMSNAKDVVWANPGFVAPDKGDFTLMPNSPLKGWKLPTRRIDPAILKELKERLASPLWKKEDANDVSGQMEGNN
ncbi:MAG TPA: hypothetical protein VK324_06300 [Tepidisphaeraceae bacterium]|nr:hypothetical protein [Tepidisphaeraceae bacterium]